LGNTHGEIIARINRAITTKKGHQAETSIVIAFIEGVKIGPYGVFL
jgi:hypothetical protein